MSLAQLSFNVRHHLNFNILMKNLQRITLTVLFKTILLSEQCPFNNLGKSKVKPVSDLCPKSAASFGNICTSFREIRQ